jgi:hypothetical protein
MVLATTPKVSSPGRLAFGFCASGLVKNEYGAAGRAGAVSVAMVNFAPQ